MNVIIFSKDRACLLDLFLRSAEKYFAGWDNQSMNIVVKFTTEEYKQAYYEKINYPFFEEEIFKEDVIDSIDLSEEHTMFFTDDDIFCNEFSLNKGKFRHFQGRDDIICFSLRLNTGLSYCYPQSKIITPPEFAAYNVFGWKGQQGYYNYPMSVNGHIFKTKDILPLLERLEYDNPTWLEYQLSINPINKPFMNCGDKSFIVNNPCNRVQSVCENRNEGLDNEKINERFLSGKRLSLDMVKNIEVKSCHQPIELIWE